MNQRVTTLLILAIVLIALSIFYQFIFKPLGIENKNSSQTPNLQISQKQNNSDGINSENVLDLSNQGLNTLPSYVLNMSKLEELIISNNKLSGALPAEIRNLKELRILNASGNLMTGIPAEIGQLQNLEILDYSNNKITGLPYELGNLKKLKKLNLSGNNYSTKDLEVIKQKLSSNVEIIL